MLSSGRIPDGIRIPDGKLLLAFSGGSDSLFLLSILSLLAPERTEAVYVNHSLRPREELDREIALNKKNAGKLGIPLSVFTIPKGSINTLSTEKNCGIEAAARELRYKILLEKARKDGFDWILTAHHREDQAETVLMRILTGSPFTSYQGIARADGKLFRPLLSVAKKDIMAYLEKSGLEWSEDSTNSDTSYMRNKVRHCIMPLVSDDERETLCRIASNVAGFRSRFPSIMLKRSFYVSICRSDFLSSLPFRQDEALYHSLGSIGWKERVSRSLLLSVIKKADEGRGSLRLHNAFFFFTETEIRVYPPLDDFVVPFSSDGAAYEGITLSEESEDEKTLMIDTSSFIPPVIVRTSRESDRIELKDGSKRISELEKEYRIPYSIVLEDRNGIVAVFARFLGGRDRLAERFLGMKSSSRPFACTYSSLMNK